MSFTPATIERKNWMIGKIISTVLFFKINYVLFSVVWEVFRLSRFQTLSNELNSPNLPVIGLLCVLQYYEPARNK